MKDDIECINFVKGAIRCKFLESGAKPGVHEVIPDEGSQGATLSCKDTHIASKLQSWGSIAVTLMRHCVTAQRCSVQPDWEDGGGQHCSYCCPLQQSQSVGSRGSPPWEDQITSVHGFVRASMHGQAPRHLQFQDL